MYVRICTLDPPPPIAVYVLCTRSLIQQFSQTTSIFMVKNYIIVCAGAENPRVRTLVSWLSRNETRWKVVAGGWTVDTLPQPNPAFGLLLTKETNIIRETCLGYQENPSFNYPPPHSPFQKIEASP